MRRGQVCPVLPAHKLAHKQSASGCWKRVFGFGAWEETKQPLLSHSVPQHGCRWLLLLEGFSCASLCRSPHLASRQIAHSEKTKQANKISNLPKPSQTKNTTQTKNPKRNPMTEHRNKRKKAGNHHPLPLPPSPLKSIRLRL